MPHPMLGLYCAIHNVNEPDGYLRCFECGHVYATPEALQAADAEWNNGVTRNVDEIHSCPECCHDF